jgi:hypothetical protein
VDDLLFYRGGELRHALEAQGLKMRDAVASEPKESLKQADVDEWARALAHHFSVACPPPRSVSRMNDCRAALLVVISLTE